MVLDLILFFVGFIVLIKGADILVEGASSFAKHSGVSSWIIGVTIVGIGTSIPELSVTVLSTIRGDFDVGLGTIIGSNTLNILLILGLSAVISPLVMERDWVLKELPPNILAVLIAIFALSFPILDPSSFFGLTRLEGGLLVLALILWIFYTISRKKQTFGKEDQQTEIIKIFKGRIATLMIIVGLIGVIIGGEWVVGSASAIAKYVGVSEALIGLTIIGIGTSLPELAISTIASYRKHFGIAVGNIVGSNIFDFLGILGIASLVRPIPFSKTLLPDIYITAFSAVLFFLAMYIGRRYQLSRWQGLIFLLIYFAYLAFIIQRG